jgi:hypothetical protein
MKRQGTGKVLPVFNAAPYRKAVWKSGCVIVLILTPELDGHASFRSQSPYPHEKYHVTHWAEGIVSLSVFLCVMEEGTSFATAGNRTHAVDWFVY